MFYKKYQFPLQLQLIFEKIPTLIYTSDVLTSNHYIFKLPSCWYYSVNLFFKKNTTFFFNTLIETSAWDSLNFNIQHNLNFFFKKNRLILFSNYYNYFTKIRLTLIFTHTFNNKVGIHSIDKLYENSQWLERETSEMFNIFYIFKKDTRSLLLDYSKKNYPLLKDFPTESWNELYYDFLEKTLQYTETIDHVEL